MMELDYQPNYLDFLAIASGIIGFAAIIFQSYSLLASCAFVIAGIAYKRTL